MTRLSVYNFTEFKMYRVCTKIPDISDYPFEVSLEVYYNRPFQVKIYLV